MKEMHQLIFSDSYLIHVRHITNIQKYLTPKSMNLLNHYNWIYLLLYSEIFLICKRKKRIPVYDFLFVNKEKSYILAIHIATYE